MRKTELITSMLLLAFSLAMILFIIPAQTEPGDGFGVPPATVPMATTIILAVLSLIYLIRCLRRPDDGQDNPLPRAAWWHIALFTGLLFAGLAAMRYLSFIPGGALIIASLMIITGQRKPLTIGLVSLVTPCLVYLALWHGLRIPLP